MSPRQNVLRFELLAIANDMTHSHAWRASSDLHAGDITSARKHASSAMLAHEIAYSLATLRGPREH